MTNADPNPESTSMDEPSSPPMSSNKKLAMQPAHGNGCIAHGVVYSVRCMDVVQERTVPVAERTDLAEVPLPSPVNASVPPKNAP